MTIDFNLDSPDYQTYQRSQLRLLIGDAAENDGPRPNMGNYQDEELDVFLRLERGDLNRTAARAFETLAAEWSRYAGTYRLGPESEEMRQAAEFAGRAAALRGQYGYTSTAEAEGGSGVETAFVDWSQQYEKWVGKF